MSNATAAGPSRGLLDILFGTGKPEKAEADGQGFGALMNLIKALDEKDKDKDEQGAELSRTLRGTMPFKGGVDNSIAGTNGMPAAPDAQGPRVAQAAVSEELKERHEKLMQLAMLSGIPVVQAAQSQSPIPDLRPEQVNGILKQNALPPLSKEEMKLLQAVNGKLELVNAGQPPNDSAMPAGLVAANPLDRLAPSMERVDPWSLANVGSTVSLGTPKMNAAAELKAAGQKVTSAEMTASQLSPAPDKMLSTESYLQMHESMSKGPAKDVTVKNPAQAAGMPAQPQAGNITSSAIAETGSKEFSLNANLKGGETGLADQDPKQAKLDAGSAGAFGASLSQHSIRTEAPMQKDIFLPGKDRPNEMRSILLGQVGDGVAMQAHKGGGEMRLVLHPDDMGEVRLKVGTRNGKVEVQVMAENEEIAKIIRGGSQELARSLGEQSLTLSKLEVSVSSTTVASSESSGNLSEQLFKQSSHHSMSGFSQGSTGDEGRSSRWDNDQGGRQGSAGYSPRSEQLERSAPRSAHSVPNQAPGYNKSGRLDVVA